MSIGQQEFLYIQELLLKETGVSIDRSKEYLLEGRLDHIKSEQKLTTINQLLQKIKSDPIGNADLKKLVLEALLTHETFFFRDNHPFESFKQVILPNIMKAKKDSRVINIWNAACSTGQEPYSLAIYIKEHFPELRSWTVNIWATDLSDQILDKAKLGLFRDIEISRGLPEELLKRYFIKEGKNWALNQEIKKMIKFEKLNLLHPFPHMPKQDIIFMRNVLIYFDEETKKEIFSKVENVLADTGYYILGSTETPINLTKAFKAETVIKTICYRLTNLKI